MSGLESRKLFEIRVPLEPVIDIGKGPLGQLMVFIGSGGTFQGEQLHGTVLPRAGGDWARVRDDGVAAIDVRLCLRTHDGANILMTYQGRLVAEGDAFAYAMDFAKPDDPAGASRYYFRTAPLFETGDARYAWLNRIVTVGIGRTADGGVIYDVYEIL